MTNSLMRGRLRGCRIDRPAAPFFTLLILLAALQPGCVRRRLTVRTDPPGALVFLDKRQIGVTPVSTSFTYYGTRTIQVFKDGYETQTIKERIRPPWYEFPPLDFIAENLWPFEIRDERVVEIELPLQRMVSNEELVGRGESLRSSARQGIATPLPNVPPPSAPGSHPSIDRAGPTVVPRAMHPQ